MSPVVDASNALIINMRLCSPITTYWYRQQLHCGIRPGVTCIVRSMPIY